MRNRMVTNMEFKPHNTAISTNGPSVPMRHITIYSPFHSDITKELGILDYGCGRGRDIKYLEGRYPGLKVEGYDPGPFGYNTLPTRLYGGVCLTYVLCCIPDLRERLETINKAWLYVARGGWLTISTRTHNEVSRLACKLNWSPYDDGWISSEARCTFQKGFSIDDLYYLVEVSNIKKIDHFIEITKRPTIITLVKE